MKHFIPVFYFFYRFVFVVIMFLWTVIIGIIGALIAMATTPNFAHPIGSFWARAAAKLIPMKVRVKGKENIKLDESYVVIVNHTSQSDILTIYGWFPSRFRWVMKKELTRIPGLGIGCQKAGHIIIDRFNPEASIDTINKAKKQIKNGVCVVFFPEGTRSKTGVLGKFKKGAFIFARDMKLPILPIIISGGRDIIPAKTFRLRPGTVKMKIQKPIYPD